VVTVGVADTNCLILLDQLDPASLPDRLATASVSLAELAAGPALASNPSESALRQIRLQRVLRSVEVLPFDEDAAMAFATVAASRRRRGRKVAARSFDALIAATAMSRGLPLYTCNPRDFEGIDGLDVVAVPHPGAP
jgi:predicted nucleic acid-binding protein